MFFLYPKLSKAYAEKIAGEAVGKSIEELILCSHTTHQFACFSPTGGIKIKTSELEKIQKDVRLLAKTFGYPHNINEDNARSFDLKSGIYLLENLFLHPSEASNIELWAFLTCTLLPDVVRWRFSGEETSIDRFIGRDRGLRRNAFGRLWWRAFLLIELNRSNPYEIFEFLVEDDLVQVTERNSIAGSPQLIKEVCRSYKKAVFMNPQIPRREIIRDATKRLRRSLSFINYDILEDAERSIAVNIIMLKTVEALSNRTETPIECH